MKILSFALNKDNEFQVIGVANVAKKTTMFQGLANGLAFVQDEDYEVVRRIVIESFQMNLKNKQEAN